MIEALDSKDGASKKLTELEILLGITSDPKLDLNVNPLSTFEHGKNSSQIKLIETKALVRNDSEVTKDKKQLDMEAKALVKRLTKARKEKELEQKKKMDEELAKVKE